MICSRNEISAAISINYVQNSNMHDHTHDVKWKKPGTKEYMLRDSIDIKYKEGLGVWD